MVSHCKRKSWEELYGVEKATEMRKFNRQTHEEKYGKEKALKIKKKLSNYRKGKTFEEKYGKEKAQIIKEKLKKPKPKGFGKKISKACKGKTWEERFGKEKADMLKKKKSLLQKGKTLEERLGKEKARIVLEKKRISKSFIIKKFQEMYDSNGIFCKSEWDRLMFCNQQTILNKFGSMDKLAEVAKRRFKKPKINISFDERFGKEKANLLRKKKREQFIGKSWEERFGKEKANKIKQKITISKEKIIKEFQDMYDNNRIFCKSEWNKLMFCNSQTVVNKFGSMNKLAEVAKRRFKKYPSQKGKTIDELFGNKKAKKIREKTKESKKHIIITKEKIIKEFKQKYDSYGAFFKSEWNNIMFCHINTVRKKFGSLDKLAELAQRRFKKSEHVVGKNETSILDKIEEQQKISLERQKVIKINKKRFFVDGYDSINNVVYEVDERYHRYQKVQDFIREENIKQKLGCNIIRINEEEFIKNINQETLIDVGVQNE